MNNDINSNYYNKIELAIYIRMTENTMANRDRVNVNAKAHTHIHRARTSLAVTVSTRMCVNAYADALRRVSACSDF